MTCTSPASAQPEPTEYFVSLANPAEHLAHVSIDCRKVRELARSICQSGMRLYQVRNFAANVEDVRAQDAAGAPAQVRNTTTSEWKIAAPPGCVVVSYDIHLDVPGPFGSCAERGAGLLQLGDGADVRSLAALATREPSAAGCSCHLGLRDIHVLGGADPGKVEQVVGVAHNYDELADSPAELGMFSQSEFQQDGATYHVVVDGDPADYDMAKLDDAAAPDHPRGGGLDAGPPLRRIHVPLSPPAWTRRRRNGARLRHGPRRQCRTGCMQSLLPLASCKRARVLPSVECEAHPAAVAGANRLPARERYSRPLVQRRRNQHRGRTCCWRAPG